MRFEFYNLLAHGQTFREQCNPGMLIKGSYQKGSVSEAATEDEPRTLTH